MFDLFSNRIFNCLMVVNGSMLNVLRDKHTKFFGKKQEEKRLILFLKLFGEKH